MAKNLTNITLANTFGEWLSKLNEVVDTINSDVLTASANGDSTIGDATLDGDFVANNLEAANTLMSPLINTSEIAQINGNTDPLLVSISMNVVFDSAQEVVRLSSAAGARIELGSNFDVWDMGFAAATDNAAFTIGHSDHVSARLTLTSNGDLSVAGDIEADGIVLTETLQANTFLAANGAAATPSISFEVDTNTGFFRQGSDSIGVSTNSTERWRFSADGHFIASNTSSTIRLADGSAAAPAIAFSDDTDTGIYSPNNGSLSIASDGIERMRITNTGNVYWLPNSGGNVTNLILSGSFLSINAEHAEGIRIGRSSAYGRMKFYNPNTTTVRVLIDASTTDNSTGTVRSDATATAAFPAFSFVEDPDTGLYRESANRLAFSTAGTRRAYISDSEILADVGISLGNRVASSREDLSQHLRLYGSTYGFSVTSNHLNMVVPTSAVFRCVDNSNTDRFYHDQSGHFCVFSAGNDHSQPTYSFTDDTDSGIYRVSANVLGISTGGNQRVAISSAGIVANSIPITATYFEGSANRSFRASPSDSASGVSFGWTNDPDTGMYRRGTDELGFSAGGNTVCWMNGSSAGAVNVSRLRAGTNLDNSNVDIGWTSDSNTGFRRGDNANEIYVVARSNKVITVANSEVTFHQNVYFPSGSDASPTISFAGAADTGLRLHSGETTFSHDGVRTAKIKEIGDYSSSITIMTREKADDRYQMSSSLRFKEELGIIPDYELSAKLIHAFDHMEPRSWIWGGELAKSNERRGTTGIGFVIEEMIDLLPEAVRYNHNPRWEKDSPETTGPKEKLIPTALDPLALCAMLHEKIKQLESELDELKAKV